jgi:hypothetical protein
LDTDLAWATLSIARRGRFPERFKTPTTVLVGAPANTRAVWGAIIAEIEEILLLFKLAEVQIVVIPTRHPFSAGEFDPDETVIVFSEYDCDVAMDASFAPEAIETSASIGGTIKLRNPDGTCINALMSVFHPFRTIASHGMSTKWLSATIIQKLTIVTEIVDRGMPPPPSTEIPIVMPATMDTKNFLTRNWSHVEQFKRLLKESKLLLEITGEQTHQQNVNYQEGNIRKYAAQETKARNTNQDVGKLGACSGFGKRLDLSLMLAPDRQIQNMLPRTDETDRLTEILYTPKATMTFSMQNVQAELQVIKKGRTTNITVGVVNAIKTVLLHSPHSDNKIQFSGWQVF